MRNVMRAHMAFAMRAAALTGTPPPSGGTWTPADLGAKLSAHWSADDTSNGAVATWTARVSATAATAAAGLQPISAATSFNAAYRGLTFDGTDDCLIFTTFTGLPTGATAGEIWAIASYALPGATAANGNIVIYGTTGAASRGLQRLNVSNVSRYRASDGTAQIADTVIDVSGPHIYGAAFAGTALTGRVDGRDTNPASAVIASLATGTVRGRIGAGVGAAAASFWPGVIRHVLITTTLTSTEREKLEGWLAWDSGLASLLPAGHPYKSARP